jgi:hypothetical protein
VTRSGGGTLTLKAVGTGARYELECGMPEAVLEVFVRKAVAVDAEQHVALGHQHRGDALGGVCPIDVAARGDGHQPAPTRSRAALTGVPISTPAAILRALLLLKTSRIILV